MDADPNYKRKQDSFGWENVNYNFDVDIIKNDDNIGFTFEYKWLLDIRKK